MITGQNCSHRAPQLIYNSSYMIGPSAKPRPAWLPPLRPSSFCTRHVENWVCSYVSRQPCEGWTVSKFWKKNLKIPEKSKQKAQRHVKATFTIAFFSKVKSESQTMHTTQLHNSHKGQTYRGPTLSQYIIKFKARVKLAFSICAQCDST